MTWLANLLGSMSSSTEKRRSSKQVDHPSTLPQSPPTTTPSDHHAPPPFSPLSLTSTPTPLDSTRSSPSPAVQKPPLYHIPTEIITATEKGMIGGSLCATIPSSSSAASSQKHDSEAKDVGEVLTRAEEACGGEGRKGSWVDGEREGGRCVMFKGVDV